jgi:hypothetical protein
MAHDHGRAGRPDAEVTAGARSGVHDTPETTKKIVDASVTIGLDIALPSLSPGQAGGH